tara:strand:- start:763 stop:1989 length:1227 start_codon:yes stop_codon:yes gene_type:complete
MKALYKLVFIACLMASSLFSQDKSVNDKEEISQEEWNDIVDYLNAEVTGMYMVEYYQENRNSLNKNSLNKKEITALKEFALLTIKNSNKNPVSFKDLSDIIKSEWKKTLQNISTPIDSLKRKDRLLDSLFTNVESILIQRKSTVFKTPKYKNLRVLIDKNYVNNIDLKVPDLIKPKAIIESPVPKIGRGEQSAFWNLWMIPSLLFLITTVVFFLMWRKTNRKHNESVELHNRESVTSKNTISNLTQKLNELKRKYTTIQSKPIQKSYGNTYNKPEQKRSIAVDEPKSPEIELIPVEKPKVPQILYVGKPTTDGKFSPVSSSPLSGQTIYKLYVHEDGLTADFEIELVDQFITREVTNAPDEYLYRVCNQENSNKEFSREIITTKKGLAVLIDGNWVVKEANKATIKFQ